MPPPAQRRRPAATRCDILWWHQCRLFRFSLLVVILTWPLNLASVILPYWLLAKGAFGDGKDGQLVPNRVYITYGMWSLCVDGGRCYNPHDVETDVGVGPWLYWVKMFVVVCVFLHGVAAACGALQNFLPRDISRQCHSFIKRALHRKCAYTEDVGFVAGFIGVLSVIIVMLATQRTISDGGTYSYSFALGFFSSSLTLICSIALAKTRNTARPRPRRRGRGAGQQGGGNGNENQRDPAAAGTGRGQAAIVTVASQEQLTAAALQAQASGSCGGATAASSTASASSPTARLDSASMMEMGDLTSLGEQADTESASLKVQLGAAATSTSTDDPDHAVAGCSTEQERRPQEGSGYGYLSSPKRGSERNDPAPQYCRDREHDDFRGESERDEFSRSPRRERRGSRDWHGDDQADRGSSNGSSGKERQLLVGSGGDSQTRARSDREKSSARASDDRSRVHRGGSAARETRNSRGDDSNTSCREKNKGAAASAYWRGHDLKESACDAALADAQCLEDGEEARDAERRARWYRGRSRSRSRSRSRERHRRQGSGGSRPKRGLNDEELRYTNDPRPSATTASFTIITHAQPPGRLYRTSPLVRSLEMENIPAMFADDVTETSHAVNASAVSTRDEINGPQAEASTKSVSHRTPYVKGAEAEKIPAACSKDASVAVNVSAEALICDEVNDPQAQILGRNSRVAPLVRNAQVEDIHVAFSDAGECQTSPVDKASSVHQNLENGST